MRYLFFRNELKEPREPRGHFAARVSTDHGSSLMELLVVISLCTIILAILQGSLRTALLSYRHLESGIEQLRAETTLRQLISQGITSSSTRLISPGWRIHPPGAIVNSSGAALPLRLMPDRRSNAISFLVLDSLTVLTRTFRGDSAHNSFCGVSARRLPEVSQWFAVSPAAAWQATASFNPLPVSSCHIVRLQLAPTHSSLFSETVSAAVSTTNELASSPIGLIGISAIYTIYLDHQGTLRRISHLRGDNQPLLYDVAAFHIRSNSAHDMPRLLTVAFQMKNSSRSRELHFSLPAIKGAHPLDLFY